jgi:hypothetical protein
MRFPVAAHQGVELPPGSYASLFAVFLYGPLLAGLCSLLCSSVEIVMRRSILIALIACLGVWPCPPSSSTAFAQATAADPETELADPYPGPAAPLDLTATGEFAQRVHALIGPGGGALRTTGADGTSYELIVPEGALREAVDISMEPILDLNGRSLGNRSGLGVILGPDGLQLATVAKLLISNSSLQQNPDLFAIAGYGRGFDSHRALFRTDDNVVTIPVWHFTIFKIITDPLFTVPQWQPRHQEDRLFHWIVQNGHKDSGAFSAALNKYREWMKKAMAGTLFVERRHKVCPALRSGIIAYNRAREAARLLQIPLDAFPDEAYFGNLPNVLATECRKQAEEDCSANGDQQILWDQVYAEADAAGGPGSTANFDAYRSGLLWLGHQELKCPLPRVIGRTITVNAAFSVGKSINKDLSFRGVNGKLLAGSDVGAWVAKGKATWTFVVTKVHVSQSREADGAQRYDLFGFVLIDGKGSISARRTLSNECNVTEYESDTSFVASGGEPNDLILTLLVRNDELTAQKTYEFNIKPHVSFVGAGESKEDRKSCPSEKKHPPIISATSVNIGVGSDRLGPLIKGTIRPNGSARDRTSFSGKDPFYVSNYGFVLMGLPYDVPDATTVTVDINLPLQDYGEPE